MNPLTPKQLADRVHGVGRVTAEAITAAHNVYPKPAADPALDGSAIQEMLDRAARDGRSRVDIPEGVYRVDAPLRIGAAGHHGLAIGGYGVTLVGSAKLDQHDWAPQGQHDEDLSPEGAPILIVDNPGGRRLEGAGGLRIEGLAFDREQPGHGAGVVVVRDEVPKQLGLYNIHVTNQHTGIGVNRCWQWHITNSRLFRNVEGMLAVAFTANATIRDSAIRRNSRHGLRFMRPDGIDEGHVSGLIEGCVIESNRGYGLWIESCRAWATKHCHYEHNGQSIRLDNPLGAGGMVIESSNFHSVSDPHADVTDYRAHVTIRRGGSGFAGVTILHNNYGGARQHDVLLLSGVRNADNVIDAEPHVHADALESLKVGDRIGHPSGGHWRWFGQEFRRGV